MGFNFPKQVGTNGNDPAEADVMAHEVEPNDIFVLASDGLFDNLYEPDIINIIRPFIKNSDTILDPELVADMIASKAEEMSKIPDYQSPFSKDAHNHFVDF
jgi:serine/threonine protein phosphatase PrpC